MLYKKSELEVFELPELPKNLKCKLCRTNQAVIEAPSLGAKLCKECFNKIFENRVKKTVEKYKMFKSENKVGVFISGGKDSSVLAVVLKKLYPDLSLKVVHINLGLRYYSERVEKKVKEFCEKFEFDLYLYKLEEKENFSIDDFILTKFKHKVCAVCGIIKRYLFSKIAKELGLEVIATGHHLDDIVSTMLNLFFQGDFVSITRLTPVNPPIRKGQAKKVKPLVSAPEKEIFYYAVLNEIPFVEENCPHGGITPAKRLKHWLSQLEKENRHIKYQILSVFYKKLIPLIKTSSEYKKEINLPVYECINCGEITSSEEKICSRCRRVALLKDLEDRLEISFEEFKALPKEDVEVIEIDEENIPGKRALLKKLRGKKDKKVYLLCSNPELSYSIVLWLRKKGIKAINVKTTN
ncbi:MAG: TIGR00269 family protein [Thermodesulfobacteria bacterium]|nr:TIGR00269 family protein [Thermodesulfobacteriota bacterium]